MRCPDCNLGSLSCGECEICGLTLADYEDACDYFDGLDEQEDQFRDDVEADADVLRSAGWGTDEDYGLYADEYEWDCDFGWEG